MGQLDSFFRPVGLSRSKRRRTAVTESENPSQNHYLSYLLESERGRNSMRLDQLPYDILFHIASYFEHPQQVAAISAANRSLRALRFEKHVCRRAIQTTLPFSREGRLMNEVNFPYHKALARVTQRRRAYISAAPASASVVGYGSSFVHHGDTLCYLAGREIHVVDLYRVKSCRTYHIDSIIDRQQVNASYLSLLSYRDGLLVIHDKMDTASEENGALVVVKVDGEIPKRVVEPIGLVSMNELFVRHNANFLCYGTLSANSNQAQNQHLTHDEWLIRVFPLNEDEIKLVGKGHIVQLRGFAGPDLGRSAAFAVHEEFFYGVTNQTAVRAESMEKISKYRTFCFPLSAPSEHAMEKIETERRYNQEGPIDDNWTDLSLQVDERTNKVVIVESRRERVTGGSGYYRTLYTTKFNPPSEFRGSSASSSSSRSSSDSDSSTRSTSSTGRTYLDRRSKDVHPEHGNVLSGSEHPITLATAKFRGYNLDSASYIDIIEDNGCCPNNPAPCIRLRMASRQPAPLLKYLPKTIRDAKDPRNAFVNFPEHPEPATLYCTRRYRYEPITLWPRDEDKHKHNDLHNIMNLGPEVDATQSSSSNAPLTHRRVTASQDSHCLIFQTRAATSRNADAQGDGPIICIGFDSTINPQAPEVWRRNEAAVEPYFEKLAPAEKEKLDKAGESFTVPPDEEIRLGKRPEGY